MKKNTFFVVGGIILIVAIFLISYYSFMFFNSRQNKIDLSTLEISFSDNGNVNLTEQSPIDDTEIDNIKPYKFKVKNNGKQAVTYQLLIEDFVSDSNKELLSRKYLNYQLKLKDKVIKSGNLQNIKNNVLTTSILKSNFEDNYELKIWLNKKAESTEWLGKSYSYNISINPIIE